MNQVVAAQEETERIKEAMNQIVGYQAVEIPSELKEVTVITVHVVLIIMVAMILPAGGY